MSVALTFVCDGCGKQAPGATASAYTPPPLGWQWGSVAEGPHACGERCWWYVQGAYRGRTGVALEATTHDSVVLEEAPAPAAAAPPVHQPLAPQKLPPVVAKADASAKVVPLGGGAPCARCGVEMPPHTGGGRPRTMCLNCNPPRARNRKKRAQ